MNHWLRGSQPASLFRQAQALVKIGVEFDEGVASKHSGFPCSSMAAIWSIESETNCQVALGLEQSSERVRGTPSPTALRQCLRPNFLMGDPSPSWFHLLFLLFFLQLLTETTSLCFTFTQNPLCAWTSR